MKTPGCVSATGRFFLRFCHLPAGVSVGGKARYLLCLCGALFTEIGLIDPILLIDHKAHHAGFTPGYRPGQQGDALVIATGDNSKAIAMVAATGHRRAKGRTERAWRFAQRSWPVQAIFFAFATDDFLRPAVVQMIICLLYTSRCV